MYRPMRLLEPSEPILLTGEKDRGFVKRRMVTRAALTCNACPLLEIEQFENSAFTQAMGMKMGTGCLTYLFSNSESGLNLQDEFGHPGYLAAGAMRLQFGHWDTVWWETPVAKELAARGIRVRFQLPEHAAEYLTPAAMTLHSRAAPMSSDGTILRVVAGRHGDVLAERVLPLPFTMLDILLSSEGSTVLPVPGGWGIVIYTVAGTVHVSEQGLTLAQPQARLLQFGALDEPSQIELRGKAHVIAMIAPLLDGNPRYAARQRNWRPPFTA